MVFIERDVWTKEPRFTFCHYYQYDGKQGLARDVYEHREEDYFIPAWHGVDSQEHERLGYGAYEACLYCLESRPFVAPAGSSVPLEQGQSDEMNPHLEGYETRKP